MSVLSGQMVIQAWEWGQRQHPIDQALTILTLAFAGTTRDGWAALSIGQRDAHLLTIYEQTFGPQLDGIADCPQCQETLEFTLAVSNIRVAAQIGQTDGVYQLATDGYAVKFRLPNSFDLALIARQHGIDSALATARSILINRCVESVLFGEETVRIKDIPRRCD